MTHASRSQQKLFLYGALLLLVSALLAALMWTGESSASAQDDSQTQAPAKPAGLEVSTQRGSLDASVDWDDVAGADYYNVQWRLHGPGQNLNDGVRPTTRLIPPSRWPTTASGS